MRRAAALLCLTLAACGYVPGRFADRPAALRAGDDAPIPLPRARLGFSADSITDLHLRHALLEALTPERTPEAGDINALDEVPAGSWFDPGATPAAPPPSLPLTLLPPEDGGAWPPALSPDHPAAALEGAVAIARDARGDRYVLRRDPPARPGLRTGAEVVAGHLARALGYLGPPAQIVDLSPADLRSPAASPDLARAFLAAGSPAHAGRLRVSATRWPPLPGVDLGATLASDTRRDDPNDRVPHRDRRTLRALGVLAGWLRLSRLDPEHLRDVYVGPPGRGHVEHHLVGLHGAFGADRVGAPAEDGGPLQHLFTLGLLPERDPLRIQPRFLSIGELDALVTVRDVSPSPPFAPLDRALPGDEYWLAKRIAALPRDALARAVAAGRFEPAAASWLVGVLDHRRAQLAIHAFSRVTPCEVDRVEPGALVLRDPGLAYWPPASTSYLVSLLSGSGEPLGPSRRLRPAPASAPALRIPLPPPSPGAYLVARVQVERGTAGPPPPPPMEVHLIAGPEAWRVRGVRH